MRRAFLLCSLFLLASCVVPEQTANQSTSSSSLSPLESVEGENRPTVDDAGGLLDENVLPGELVFTGDLDAPLTILLFTNFSCRYCRDFHEVLTNVATPYLESGQLRIVTVPHALQKYPRSTRDAAIFTCSAYQHESRLAQDLLFTQQSSTVIEQSLMDAGVEHLENCLGEDGEEDVVRDEQQIYYALAEALSVTVVPSYFINGEKFMGVPTEADLRGAIEAAIQSE